jgi:hypothetical protein
MVLGQFLQVLTFVSNFFIPVFASLSSLESAPFRDKSVQGLTDTIRGQLSVSKNWGLSVTAPWVLNYAALFNSGENLSERFLAHSAKNTIGMSSVPIDCEFSYYSCKHPKKSPLDYESIVLADSAVVCNPMSSYNLVIWLIL